MAQRGFGAVATFAAWVALGGCGGQVAGSDGMPTSGGSGGTGIPTIEPDSGGSPTAAGGSDGGPPGTGGIAPCVQVDAYSAKSIPPALEFLIDVGSSMADTDAPSTEGQSKWSLTREVLRRSFAALPARWAVGVAYFNQPVGQTVYAGHQAVPIAPLTAEQLAAIDASLDAVTPAGLTPTFSAWQFAFDHLSSWSLTDAGYLGGKFIVLVTDSVPTVNHDGATSGAGMNGTVNRDEYDTLIEAVANGAQSTGIKTFVVGVPGSEDPEGAPYDPLYELTLLANAGQTEAPNCTRAPGTVVDCYDTLHQRPSTCLESRGTYCHFDLTLNSDFVTGLVASLSAVATGGPGCQFLVPPTDGRAIDPNGVIITCTPDGGLPLTLTQSTDGCATGDWSFVAFDSNGQPAELDLCPGACEQCNTEGSSVHIAFTCLPD